MPRRPVRRTVDLRPVFIVFIIAFLVLGLGLAAAIRPEDVLIAFFGVLLVAFLVLARSIIRR